MSSPTDTIRVLDPTGGPAIAAHPLTPRGTSLDGKVVGFLDNTKHNFDRLCDEVAGLLTDQCAGVEFRRVRKANPAIPVPPELLTTLLTQCDVVVTGSGD
ncbi:MAG: hypothetical protein HY329_19830 [Chloroflexi bacterium]|nr:hypothetical protein [Chloroflexota bacterium]